MIKPPVFITCLLFLVGVGWLLLPQKLNPDALLTRSDLSGTSVVYLWKGGFSFDGDVRAEFFGNGTATLQLGDDPLIKTNISDARYRGLLRSLATNKFNQIRVHRRWGTYLHDMGRCELVLSDGKKRMVVYADAKHFVEPPELINPITEEIYSFQKEFGKRLDYAPFGMTETRDTFEILLLAGSVVGVILMAALFIYARKRKLRKLKKV